MLQIELRADDHQRHHIQASCNFSKRFSLWDRLFGTFVDGATPHPDEHTTRADEQSREADMSTAASVKATERSRALLQPRRLPSESKDGVRSPPYPVGS